MQTLRGRNPRIRPPQAARGVHARPRSSRVAGGAAFLTSCIPTGSEGRSSDGLVRRRVSGLEPAGAPAAFVTPEVCVGPAKPPDMSGLRCRSGQALRKAAAAGCRRPAVGRAATRRRQPGDHPRRGRGREELPSHPLSDLRFQYPKAPDRTPERGHGVPWSESSLPGERIIVAFHACCPGRPEALQQVRRAEATSGVEPRPLAEGRPLSAVQGLRAALASGKRRARGRVQPPLARGEQRQAAWVGPPLSGAKANRNLERTARRNRRLRSLLGSVWGDARANICS